MTVWDAKSLIPIKTHCNYDAAINDASFSHDSQLLALGGEDLNIKINYTMTGQHIACLSSVMSRVGLGSCTDVASINMRYRTCADES